jgi:hypothetical protein
MCGLERLEAGIGGGVAARRGCARGTVIRMCAGWISFMWAYFCERLLGDYFTFYNFPI